jgi:hypothetical protein
VCFVHSPRHVKALTEGRSRGGQNHCKPAKVLPATAPPAPLDTVADVRRVITETVAQVRTGAIDVRVANSLGVLLNVALRAAQATETEELRQEVARLTDMVRGSKSAPHLNGAAPPHAERGKGRESAWGPLKMSIPPALPDDAPPPGPKPNGATPEGYSDAPPLFQD